jgi:hypothetical protein
MSEDESRFEASFDGIGRLLKSDMMKRAMEEHAARVMAAAVVLAPVSEKDKHPGRYKRSFKMRVGLNARRTRVEAVVYNDSPEALHVEKGTRNNNPYHVLTRALDVLRGG